MSSGDGAHRTSVVDAIGGVFEALFFHGVYRLSGMGKEGIGGRHAETKTVFQREPKASNAWNVLRSA